MRKFNRSLLAILASGGLLLGGDLVDPHGQQGIAVLQLALLHQFGEAARAAQVGPAAVTPQIGESDPDLGQGQEPVREGGQLPQVHRQRYAGRGFAFRTG